MNELDQAFETLRNLLGRRNSGAQWGGALGAKRGLVQPKPMQATEVNCGYTLGASDEEIRDAGEELLLYRCGLAHQQRLRPSAQCRLWQIRRCCGYQWQSADISDQCP